MIKVGTRLPPARAAGRRVACELCNRWRELSADQMAAVEGAEQWTCAAAYTEVGGDAALLQFFAFVLLFLLACVAHQQPTQQATLHREKEETPSLLFSALWGWFFPARSYPSVARPGVRGAAIEAGAQGVLLPPPRRRGAQLHVIFPALKPL